MTEIAIEIDKARLHDFCRRWMITEFALFGSVTRPAEFESGSDVDVLATFADDAPWSLLHMVGMKEEHESIFGRPVDLLTRLGVEKSLNRFRREAILGSAVYLDVA